MNLYIAEKPSLGRAIVEALGQAARKDEGCVRLANGDVVSWCIGHLLEQAEPEDYDPALKRWSHATLPILPREWQLKPKPATAQQLKVLTRLIREADSIVHAGDPDREGQLLVDEVIDHALRGKHSPKAVQRCLISDLNPPAVRRALDKLRPNSDFAALSQSALARSRADWLYGMNLTRAFTLQGQQAGFSGVLSVGRVQTPVLGLVVQRDRDIENFNRTPYFNVWASLQTESGEQFRAKWQPSAHCERYLDDKNRCLSRALAEHVVQRVSFQPARVQAQKTQQKREAAPLPHNLSSLQIEANKRFGFSAQAVLDICQRLYEQHKLITYPRSDCRHLPEEHWPQARATLKAIAQVLGHGEFAGEALCSPLLAHVPEATTTGKAGRAWNDSKVEAHHAIVPTLKAQATLTADEQKIYFLISRHYLAQFLPEHRYREQQIDVDIAGGLFVARAKTTLAPGWRVLFPGRADEEHHEEGAQNTALPTLKKDEALQSLQALIEEKLTTPPAPFTDATLLAAMTGIARYVNDSQLKAILKSTDGLGTEATRAGIIELLIKRGFIQRQAKRLHATPAGRALIAALPASISQPDRTAHWEMQLQAIAEKNLAYDAFIEPLTQEISALVAGSREILPVALKGLNNGKKSKTQSRQGVAKKSTFKKRSAAADAPSTPQTRQRRSPGRRRGSSSAAPRAAK